MRRRSNSAEEQENPFSQSVGDLMSALLLVFVLLLIIALVNNQQYVDEVKEKQQDIEAIGEAYNNSKRAIYHDLDSVFSNRLKRWEAEIDSVTLSVHFHKEGAMFDFDKSDVKPEFQQILSEFFPEYLRVIAEHKEEIEEIRVEGHTSEEGKYFHNMKLSQDRARNVLEYCYGLPNMDIRYLEKKVTANGYSSSRPLGDYTKSRRVEFRVITKSEQRIKEIMKKIETR